MHSRTSLPVIPQITVELDAEEQRKIAGLARRLIDNEPALNATEAFGPRVAPGLGEGPAFLLEDHREIALFEEGEDLPLEYRARLLAQEGDLVAIGGRRNPVFEAYCEETLGLGHVSVLHPPTGPAARRLPLAIRCMNDPAVFARLIGSAERHGALNIVPFIGMGSVWKLAGALAAKSDVDIKVAASPPRLTRRVNDKLWFAACVSELFGREALPPTYSAYGPAALAGRLAFLARRYDQVVVKVPDSAGSQGNIVLDSASLRDVPLAELRLRLRNLLRTIGWRGAFPLMVGVWECPVISSPSVQLWIPTKAEGPPVIEGLFDQVVHDVVAEFIGSEPSDLSNSWQHRIATEAFVLAQLFQALGYYGRCSLDAVIVGTGNAPAQLHWVECNGRWGGASLPLTLANRLTGNWASHPFIVVQRTEMHGPSRSFTDVLGLIGDRLLRAGDRATGVIILAPGRIEEGTGMNFMVVGKTVAEARAEANLVVHLLMEGTSERAA